MTNILFLNVVSGRCTTAQPKAHVTKGVIFYRFHPWHGRELLIVSSMVRKGLATFRCRLLGDSLEKFYDIPQWMFDEVACHRMREDEQAKVSISALRSLSQCIADLNKLAAGKNTHFQNGDARHETIASQATVPDSNVRSTNEAPSTRGTAKADSRRSS